MAQCPFCSEPIAFWFKPVRERLLGACGHCMNPLLLTYDGVVWKESFLKGAQDVRTIASEGSIGGELLKLAPGAIEHLPVLPEIAQRILSMVHDPDVSIQDLVEVIDQDQVVALKILRLANSATYGGLVEIKRLDAACARLGMRNVASAVQAIANGKLYVTKEPRYKALMHDLWRHSLAAAHAASEIGVLLAEPRSEVLFVAGLVHDVGKVLLLDLVASAASAARKNKAIETLRQSNELLDEFLGDYHRLLGLHIALRWNLPPEFAIAAFCHNRLESVPDDAWLPLVHIISLASAIANVSGFGGQQSDISLLSHPSAKALGLNDLKLASLRVDLEEKLAPFLEISMVA